MDGAGGVPEVAGGRERCELCRRVCGTECSAAVVPWCRAAAQPPDRVGLVAAA